MLPVALVLANAHQPHFPHHNFPFGSTDRALKAEPSVAYYDAGAHNYTIKYEKGDFMYLAVLAPAARGFYSALPRNIAYNITMADCVLGPQASNSHAKFRKPGYESYEPFGESAFTTMATVLHGHTSNVSQTCVLSVTASRHDAPYVVVAGTKEEVAEAMVAGLPVWVSFVSAWNANHVYIYTLGVLLIAAGAVGARWPEIAVLGCAVAILLVTSISRTFQVAWAGVGVGLIFAVVPVIIAVAIVAARNRRTILVVIALLASVTPTHSWLDVAALAFLVYTTAAQPEHRATVGRPTTSAPSTVNPAPSFVVRYT